MFNAASANNPTTARAYCDMSGEKGAFKCCAQSATDGMLFINIRPTLLPITLLQEGPKGRCYGTRVKVDKGNAWPLAEVVRGLQNSAASGR